jgi:hypothetical protein
MGGFKSFRNEFEANDAKEYPNSNWKHKAMGVSQMPVLSKEKTPASESRDIERAANSASNI